MRIEIALDPSTSPHKQRATKAQILAELEHVRESCKYWNSLIWTVRMFEAVIARTRLGPVGANGTSLSPNGSSEAEVDEEVASVSHNGVGPGGGGDASHRRMEQAPNDLLEGVRDLDAGAQVTDDVFGILPVTDDYDWLEGLFGAPRSDVGDPAVIF
ncbi:hypothetical protein FOPE_07709 [Fonsecaea pedrosoi]|nr:hypothetical protein FOPE_07709 [Fonsecaea pedrosoi]